MVSFSNPPVKCVGPRPREIGQGLALCSPPCRRPRSTLLLPLAPSRNVTDPPDNVVSVTVTVLLPAARLIVLNLLTPPRLAMPASSQHQRVGATAAGQRVAADRRRRDVDLVVLEPAGEAVRPRSAQHRSGSCPCLPPCRRPRSTLLLPLAPSWIVTAPPDSVVSVTVTVLLPAAR